MTAFDKELIRKAENLRRYDYHLIDTLILFADTEEGRKGLTYTQDILKELVAETVY